MNYAPGDLYAIYIPSVEIKSEYIRALSTKYVSRISRVSVGMAIVNPLGDRGRNI